LTAIQIAFDWYERGSRLHNVTQCHFHLSHCYTRGRVVPKDDKVAFELMLKAATAGVELASFELSDMYQNGVGTKKDPSAAQHWREKAAAFGDPANSHGATYETSDPHLAYLWWHKSATWCNNPHAQVNNT
jgi:TPR repeat protein